MNHPTNPSDALHDYDLPAGITREHILQVMKACDITDYSEETIRMCVDEALLLRGSSTAYRLHPPAPETTDHRRHHQDDEAAFDRVNEDDAAPTMGVPLHQPSAVRALPDGANDPAASRSRDPPPRSRGHVASPASGLADSLPPRGASPDSDPALMPPPRTARPAAVHRNTHRPTTARRVEHDSTASLRGTPVVGLHGQQGGMAGGARPASAGPGVGRGGVPPSTAPRFGAGGHPALRPRPANSTNATRGKRSVPGYMSSVYADHLREHTAAAEADDGASSEDPKYYRDARRGRYDPQLAASAHSGEASTEPLHQQRYGPFAELAGSTADRPLRPEGTRRRTSPEVLLRGESTTGRHDDHVEGGSRPAPARRSYAEEGTAHERREYEDRHHRHIDPNSSAVRTPRPGSALVNQSARSRSMQQHHQYEHAVNGVIYGPLASKTYLAGGFRGPASAAPVASPRLGPPRRASDPVRRYQQMKRCWEGDPFLHQQKPMTQRRKLRWAVRNSMNDWIPPESTVVHVPPQAYY